jgi:Cu/Ag efflux pump CusA
MSRLREERGGFIDRVIELSLRNRPVVLLGALALAAAGAVALWRMPVDAIPDLSENQVIVFADWPGHAPRELEDHVTYPLSAQLQGLRGVKAVRASSELNFSMVSVIFDDAVAAAAARAQVLERLSLANESLPPGVTAYLAPDATALGQIFAYTVEGAGRDLGELRAIQDYLVRLPLSSVDGVAAVASMGGFIREYQIDVDPDRLRAFNVSLGDVFAAAGRSNGAAGGGVLVKGGAEYLIRGAGWIEGIADLESSVVASRAGVPVYLRNVASVRLGPAPRRSVLEKGGGEAVGGIVLMRAGENPLAVTGRVQARLAELQASLPQGVRVVPFYERTRLIRGAMSTLRTSLLEEMVACILMVLLVLGHLRASLVVIVTLPVAVLAAFLGMHLFGVPSNIMSLAGIAIAIGVLADSAVVMTENAYSRLHDRFGDKPVTGDTREIVLAACKVVGRPLFFSVLITAVSFIPVFALTGMEGRMFRPLAFTKTFALLGVALLCVTLVPALIPGFVRGRLRGEQDSFLVRSVAGVYRPVLLFLLDRPKWVIASLALLLALGFNLKSKIGSEFMPRLDEGAILDMPVTAPGVSAPQAAHDLVARDALLRTLPEVELVVGKAGRADTPTDPAPLEMIETVVNLRPHDEWPRRAIAPGAFRDAVAAAIPAASEEKQPELARDAAARFDRRAREIALGHLRDGKSADDDLQAQAGALFAGALRDAAAAGGLRLDEARLPRAPLLSRKTKEELVRELDSIVRVPGWSNIWTEPLINRVDMLATGIRTQVGVRVLGADEQGIQKAANDIAAVLRGVPGAVDVFPDQIAGKGYLQISIDRERAARLSVASADVNEAIEVALGGKPAGTALSGRRRLPVRVRYAADFRDDEEKLGRVLVGKTPLGQVARVATVQGPSMIKSENGILCAYVQLNVHGRDLRGFVEEAQARVASAVTLPPGVFLQWGGELEHEISARRTLLVVFPLVILLIFCILFWTYRDAGDAALMMLAVPGALVGGLVCQRLMGFQFSVAVWVGYIACFGLATETGIVMLVYLREAIDRRGGLGAIGSVEALREAVAAGAIQRLRPKLLTEGLIVLSLLPMLWSSGVGAEILRPMAAPVLGGILVADEVIDVTIPVLFFWLRKRRWLQQRAALEAAALPAPRLGLTG